MKIQKAKLIKGTFLSVEGHDGNKEFKDTWKNTEAPPRLLKAFMALNHHMCDLSEQYDETGNKDYDNVSARGYSQKGEDDKEGVTLTGLRTLSTGRTITLNSPFISLDNTESEYKHIANLIFCLDKLREEIILFMENNKSTEQIQGNLFRQKPEASPENIILKSKDPVTAVDIVFKDVNDAIEKNSTTPLEGVNVNPEEKSQLTQAEMDANDPVRLEDMTLEFLIQKARKTVLTPEEQGRLQLLNAGSKKADKSTSKIG